MFFSTRSGPPHRALSIFMLLTKLYLSRTLLISYMFPFFSFSVFRFSLFGFYYYIPCLFFLMCALYCCYYTLCSGIVGLPLCISTLLTYVYVIP
ncbi:hypothetical protein L208DRAFT_127791 [Tricholoma matsutake]|nr:hypothetical protein L208DRAFT_127791 [Tricholoma matsutake 945]